MASELSLNQTVQAEVGEFNYLYLNGEEVAPADINGDITLDDLPDLNEYPFNEIKTNNVLLGTWTESIDSSVDPPVTTYTFTQDIDVRQTLVDYGNSISSNAGNIASNTGRIVALENAPFDSSIVDALSTNVQALQTRTGTLESLIGLLTNNNTNDTAIEHRISRLEKTILALKAIHDAKKSVYNIPVDW
jgi:hypothetical protein